MSSMLVTFMRSPVEKQTSLPEISYIDPETESDWVKKGTKNLIDINQGKKAFFNLKVTYFNMNYFQ